MGVFGVVRDANGNPLGGVTVTIFGSSVPPVTSRNGIYGAASDRNYEMNLFQPGNYQVGVSDGAGESPKVPITVNYYDQCDVKEGQAGGQWQQVDFRHN